MDALRTACKQQVDLENHAVISDAEWASYISRAYGELWTIVFEAGLQYFEYATTFTTDGSSTLDEPADHLSTVALAYVEPTGHQYELRLLQPQEVSRASRMGSGSGRARWYALVDNKIRLYPTPPAGQSYELRYVPQSPNLATFAGDACVDVVTPDGEDFVIWSTAVRACGKTEADPGLALREREAARERFTESVRQRAMTAPRRLVVDYEEEADLW